MSEGTLTDLGQHTPFNDVEAAQLRRLVYQAWDLRDGPYIHDACRAVVELHERTLPDRLERQARRGAA